MKLTRTQREALKSLREHGGEGVFTKDGHLLAAGAILGQYNERDDESGTQHLPFGRATWRRLGAAGLVEDAGPRRIRVSEKGREHK